MRKIFQILAVPVILFLTATFAFSQKAQRITFKRGAKQAIVTGNLYSYKSRRVFLIRVRRGQTLRVEQRKSDASLRYITVAITAPNGEDVTDSDASCNNRKRVSPTRAGDYRIEVYECQKADAWRGKFWLKVRVE
jgi:hypothetical protein